MTTPRVTLSMLTVDDICTALNVARRTFYEWRQKDTAPPCLKLPNGELRIRAVDFDRWMDSLKEIGK
ncbi:helix-turn-helix transcriptional regulator [Amycolatopsis sp. CA-230715]|uniref:helix-turn-helix transcriptional regulator n=1 Tax=Amycolatopsis sp. CA-230715 TaxID=2745196 RepID=UPI001C33280E|nr:helix-turn-helix domain-containing protein [Amycolatopsis sp. CA-230715]QWF79766.1 hypothetical protein HUW46_03178 [Amycolatopsis sp. CA-230715]